MVSMSIVGVLCALTVVASAKEFFRPEGGRQVFPLVPIGGGPGPDTNTGPVNPPVNPPTGGGTIPTRTYENEKVTYVESKSGTVPCVSNVDCYGYREPDEWCPLPAGGVYRDRGCWCDKSIGACVIDRIVAGAKQWAWCNAKGASRC